MPAAPTPTIIDGVDIDAVARAARSCPAVDDLDGGRLGGVATYLPGRRVPGVELASGVLTLSVRSVWGVPAATVASQLRAAVTKPATVSRIDVMITDITDPAGSSPTWTTDEDGEPKGAPTSALTTPTVAAIPSSSPSASNA